MGGKTTKITPYALLIFKSQKSLWALSFLLLICLITAWFLGQTAIIEAQKTSRILMTETARLFCVFGPAFLLSSFLLDFQKRGELQVWLTRGTTRTTLIGNFFLIGIILSLIQVVLSLLIMSILLQEISLIGALPFIAESMIFLSTTLFFSLNLSTSLKVYTLLIALYALGRLKGFFLSSLAAPWLDYSATSNTICKIFLAPIPNFAAFNTPNPSWEFYSLETLLSCAFFMAMTHWSFRKKCL